MSNSSQLPTATTASQPSTDKFVRDTIEKLRLRLLDLTSRNPLIAFKHAGRSRRHLRVIDELPNQLLAKLEGDSGMRFRSLGRRTDEPEDEKTVAFRRALAAAKLEDPEYRQRLIDLGDDPGDKALDRLERDLRQRLREQLGMPPRRDDAGLSPADVARQANIDPSFDLPVSPPEGQALDKHADSTIQTLLFDDDMQLTLARIREVVRLSIDEAGVNPLFCVFGFLEWYEDAGSDTPLHAPLLLCPLTIERKLSRGQYQYTVHSTDEELQLNMALAERLKRDFNLAIPPFEDDDTPESYFSKVHQVIEGQRGWKVRRWCTVGLFSFARIVMYHDLAAERWTSVSGGLEKHAGLSRLIAGGGAGAGGKASAVDVSTADAAEDDRSASEVEFDIPMIADADSSQLAALRDVLSGRSLVIEGPPGTGKSQTITNLIAASLASGKTVLFLAEKMAALNVVRDRLAHAGLDDFCLELHSTKAGRKETSQALARRLGRKAGARQDADLQAALARLRELRDGLARGAEALGQPAGALGISVQELLWRVHAVRQRSQSLPSDVDEIWLDGAEKFTTIDVDRIATAADQFERARARTVASHGSIAKHPWNGIAGADIDPVRAEDVVRRVRRVADAAAAVVQVFEEVESLTGARFDTIDHLSAIAEARSIPEPAPASDDQIIARVIDPQVLARMHAFAQQLREHAEVAQSISPAFATPEAADACTAADARVLAESVAGAGLSDATVHDLPARRERLRAQVEQWRSFAELMDAIARRAGLQQAVARTGAVDRALLATIELAAEANADPEILATRSPSVLANGATVKLREATGAAEELHAHRANLAERFELVAATEESATFRQHAAALRAAPFLPFLSPAWWRARAAYLGASKTHQRTSRAEMARSLDALANYADAHRAYAGDETLKALVGLRFKGIDTDLKPVLKTAEWADRVRARLPAGEESNLNLRRLLFEGSADQLELLAAVSSDPRFEALRSAIASNASGDRSVEAHSKYLATAVELSGHATELSARVRLKEDFAFAGAQNLSEQISRRDTLHDALASSESAKSVLGTAFQGHRTAPEPIEASAAHVRNVSRSGVAPALRDWLLGSDATARLASLKPLAEAADAAASGVQQAISELTKFVNVDFVRWLATPEPLTSKAIDLRGHAARCADDPGSLNSLIDDMRCEREARGAGIGPVIDLLESRRAPLTGLGVGAKRIVYQSLTRETISRHPALASFTGERHEALRSEFRELDQRLKRLRQAAIANSLAARKVDPGSDTGPKKQWTGLALVQNETAKQRGHIAVRDVMDRAGATVQQLMPCFMMSPLSVAQFLKPGALTFDLVVMDEASQLRPEDAVGAVARGGQLVVVGDPKQLPPTSFFHESYAPIDVDEDDDQSVADEPSILDQALSIMRPARRLKWHYRSRHASLIAFSNKEFYDSQLIVFPSPYHEHEDFGVKYVYVEEGSYRNRVNVPEARRVAQAALEFAARHADRSLGIATLNQPQAELIGLEIDRLAAENEAFEAWRQQREQSLEPFFVKNLENVQGDERDAIFISTVYGPEKPGERQFPQRFGPINNQGGHRRLNVLFTRAKCQTVVFSSMDPVDLRTDEKSSWGVRALKGYLQFAKDGRLDLATETGRPPDSDFEQAVADALRTAGLEVVPQVGVVGYFIDLAVRHPKRAGEYVLGVECDGAMYHSSRSARDRDRLRQEVLERLKWRIHRIWSLDWYRNPKRETERLVKAVEDALASDA